MMQHHEVHIESVNGTEPAIIILATPDDNEAEHFAAEVRRQPRWFPNVVRVVAVHRREVRQ